MASDRIITGRASSHPVILDTAAQHARQANAEPPIRKPPPPPPQPPQLSRFATSSATFPSEGHGENWHPQDPYGQDPSTRSRGATSGGVNPTCIPLFNRISGVGMATWPTYTAIIRRALILHRFMCSESRLETIIKGLSKPRLPASTSGTSTPLVMVFNESSNR
jgi:hypothetical protein